MVARSLGKVWELGDEVVLRVSIYHDGRYVVEAVDRKWAAEMWAAFDAIDER
jgi:hypothetical protein